ncbi:iron-siderophore ABC transporter substrate-binding protein [Occultella aeris]|uniref:Fe(3+)-citrate-binding protein YfmC n=1 Tax=Occultella aeris TaxID=2761496 RepID=A0A7M4DIG7_9MICO|nr:iron-siderophore ABC transporter substrate-binding protein [Occultella aeris]VZO36740.1 Fe(3+)-citrate-binding protein YfmC precursor [Occultella aeris]
MNTSIRRRRTATVVAASLGATLFLAGCGSSDEPAGADPSGSGSEGYPVTVDSAHGEVTVDQEPERIVVIGTDIIDLLHSIDVQPVAFSGYGDPDEEAMLAAYPWVTGLYTGQFDATLVTAEYKADPEAIALHEPDLIIGTPYYIEEQQYEQLSAIAPTYVVPSSSAGWEWTDTLSALGNLTGKSEEATQAIAAVEDEFTAARDRLTGLQGSTLSIADYWDGSLRLMTAFSWIQDLGLTPAENQPGAGSAFETLSLENLDQFDGDLAFMITYSEEDRASLEADPRYAALPSVEGANLFFIDRSVIDAGVGPGPASLSWLLERILPLLEASELNAGGQ